MTGQVKLDRIFMRRFLDRRDHGRTDFTFGIEEEYFLNDATTRQAASRTPDELFEQANAATNGRIEREFQQAQAEAITRPQYSMAHARAELCFIRREFAALAATHGLSMMACGTHPTSHWRDSRQTEGERYDIVMQDLKMVGRRDMLCGTHIHVEVPDSDRRVEIMCRMTPYLPLFVALSTSSPFWISRNTGLKGYRAYDELPRTGVPELLRTTKDYSRYVRALVGAEVIEECKLHLVDDAAILKISDA